MTWKKKKPEQKIEI